MKLAPKPASSFGSVSRGYRFYVLALLTLVFIINFIDRQVLSVLIEPIKRDLHLTDTLETAAACGVSIRPRRRDEPALARVPESAGSPEAAFDRLMTSWFPLTYVLNNLNRGLGVPDAYPFVLSKSAIEKLRFVHDVIAETAGAAQPGAAAPRAAAAAASLPPLPTYPPALRT